GPVIPIVSFQSEEELIEMVNDSEHGLTATVYGGSESLQTQLQLSHGRVFVDSCIVDPEHALCRLFWGGFRNSGWVWERTNGNFVHREGPRRMLAELAVL